MRLGGPVSHENHPMTDHEEFHRWVVVTWRRDQIPVWKAVLAEAEAKGQHRRAEYARWLLQEVLEEEQVEVGEKKP